MCNILDTKAFVHSSRQSTIWCQVYPFPRTWQALKLFPPFTRHRQLRTAVARFTP